MQSDARLLRLRAAAIVVTAFAVLMVAAAGASGSSAHTLSVDLPADAGLIGWHGRTTKPRLSTTAAKPKATTTTAKPTTTTAAATTTTVKPTTTTAAPTTTTAPPPTTAPAGAPSVLFDDGFEGAVPVVPWLDDSRVGGWTSIYNGYGLNNVEVDGTKVLSESPLVSTRAGDTHASLVVTSNAYGDFDATVRMKTVSQLRIGSAPNPWEVGWVLWHHSDDEHFYSFVPKPNGWELGKEDPAYPGAQRYLATGSSPTFPIGRWYTVRIRQVGSTMTVWVDGVQIVTATDTQRPYASGAFGLYNEDSHVRFDDVHISTAS